MSLIQVSTSATDGAAFVPFAGNRAGNGSITNDTGVSLDLRLSPTGAVTKIASGLRFPFNLVWSTAEVEVRRTDQVATAVTVELEFSLGSLPPSSSGAFDPSGTAAAAVAGLISDSPFRAVAGVKVTQTSRSLLGMDSSGNLFAVAGLVLQKSTDNGATWATLYTFPVGPIGIRQLDNGELLVGVGESPGLSRKASVWLSAGYASGSPTFSQVLESSGYLQSIELGWNFGSSGSIVVVNEYGTDARYVYLSQDSGATWATVYDNGVSATPVRHLHGCTYDPYRGAIWISGGDYNGTNDNQHISVSWNLGANWTKVTSHQQPTVIVAFPNCVCFGTDNTPNGVLRISDPSPTNLRIELAYAIDESRHTGNAALFWHRNAAQGSPTLITYGGAQAGTVGIVLASYDGFAWFRLWADSVDASEAKKAFGPTNNGKILIQTPQGGGFGTLVTIDAPRKGMLEMLEREARARRTSEQLSRKPFVWAPNTSDPYDAVAAYTYTLIHLAPLYGYPLTPYQNWRDDPDSVFSCATDGITVNRSGIFTVIADCCLNMAAGLTAYCLLKVAGNLVAQDKSARVTWKGQIAAGQKVTVEAFCTSATTCVGSTALSLTAEILD